MTNASATKVFSSSTSTMTKTIVSTTSRNASLTGGYSVDRSIGFVPVTGAPMTDVGLTWGIPFGDSMLDLWDNRTALARHPDSIHYAGINRPFQSLWRSTNPTEAFLINGLHVPTASK